MRILHAWDQAGVASVLAKYQRKLGHEVDVVKRREYADPCDMYYCPTLLDCGVVDFYRHVAKLSKNYDLVHVHSQDKCLPLITKPKIIHYHGSDIRHKTPRLHVFADKVLVSTPDLTVRLPQAEWLPNPVDIELFNPSVPENAVHLDHPPHIPHGDMPGYLSSMSSYTQPAEKPWALSKTSLEALACGTPVKWNGLCIRGLPERHRPENVTRRLVQIYEKVLGWK